MINVRLADDYLSRKKAVHLPLTGDVFDIVLLFCCPFSHEMNWMRSGTELFQLLRICLPTFKKKLDLEDDAMEMLS